MGASVFEKVMLFADSNLQEDCMLSDAVRVLKEQGRLILFAQCDQLICKENDIMPYCFNADRLLSQINRRQLEIESVSMVRYRKSMKVMCLIVKKQH